MKKFLLVALALVAILAITIAVSACSDGRNRRHVVHHTTTTHHHVIVHHAHPVFGGRARPLRRSNPSRGPVPFGKQRSRVH